MHDLILAKEIIDTLKKVAINKKLNNIKKVSLEIGTISMSHDGHSEHTEDISVENLQFNLENIKKNTFLAKVEFSIKKIPGEHWKITEIEI